MNRVNKTVLACLFLIFMWHANLYLKGSLSGRSVRSVPFTSGSSDFDGRDLFVNLSGSQDHSLAWDLDAAATITISLGVDGGDGVIYFTPSELGFNQVNPIVLGGADSDMIPLVIPVSQKIRISISGTASGRIIFSDS